MHNTADIELFVVSLCRDSLSGEVEECRNGTPGVVQGCFKDDKTTRSFRMLIVLGTPLFATVEYGLGTRTYMYKEEEKEWVTL